MNEKPDRLRLLKSKYLSQITAKETELVALRHKVQLIDELENDAEKLTESPVNGDLKYAQHKFTIKEAAFDVVKTIGGMGINAPKVAKYLLDNGFKANGDNFIISVGTSLRRLVEDERVLTEKREGSRVYLPKL